MILGQSIKNFCRQHLSSIPLNPSRFKTQYLLNLLRPQVLYIFEGQPGSFQTLSLNFLRSLSIPLNPFHKNQASYLDFSPLTPQSSRYVVLIYSIYAFSFIACILRPRFSDFWGFVNFCLFGLWVVLLNSNIVMYCISLMFMSIFRHSLGLCDWLCLSLVVWNEFLPYLQKIFLLMSHVHAFPCIVHLFLFLFSFLAYLLLLSLSLQSIFPWHPKRAFLNAISFPVILLHLLLFLLTSSSMIQTTIRLLRRTFLCFLFMMNIRFFYLSFQTLWYLSRLDLVDGTFSMNTQLPTRVCLYKSSTPNPSSL